MNDLLIIAGAWFIGAFINGLTGMGGALIALPLISMFVSSKEVILISLISGSFVGTMTMVFYWRYINIREVLSFWLPAIPGIALGVWTLKVVNMEVLELLLCTIIVLHIVVQFIQEWLGTCMAPRTAMKYICSFLTGFFGGSLSICGPIMVIYASIMCMEKNKARGFFASATVTSYFNIVLVAANGMLTEQVLSSCFWVAPSAVIGFLCACPLAKRIKQKTFNIALLILLAFAALSLFVRVIHTFL